MRVLVGCTGRNGTTREIAERIAARLGEHGHQTDLRLLSDVRDLSEYHAVVIGSPVYSGAWTREASEFLTSCQADLATRPVWSYTVGLKGTQRGLMRRLFNSQHEPAQVAELHAIAPRHQHQVFTGRIRRHYLPLPARLFFEAVGGRYGDFRNWDAIDSWAVSIAKQLEASVS